MNVADLEGVRVAIVGDLTADYVVRGEPLGIAREDGALWLAHREEVFAAGRAGRAAFVVKALGAEPLLVGVVGKDVRGDALLASLEEKGVATDRILRVSGHETPERRRTLLVGPGRDDRLVLRVDREPRRTNPAGASSELLGRVREATADATALLLVDGGHGVASPGVAELFSGPKVVTSERRIGEFRGASFLVLTDEQAERAGGRTVASDGATRAVAKDLLARTGARHVLLLRGRLGVAHVDAHGEEELLPADFRPVTGEEVATAAALALALGAGRPVPEAVRFAVERWDA